MGLVGLLLFGDFHKKDINMGLEQMFTELPSVGSASMSDVICAVQGYSGPSTLGLSVQETLQQVYNLFQSNIILSYPGDPNGNLAGTTYQLCWDTVDSILWVCTISGTESTAVWTQVTSNAEGTWTLANSTPITVASDHKYVASNGATLTTFVLPAIASFGTTFEISGFSSGGWILTQNAGQSINFGNLTTTAGVGGSLSSTNQNDYIKVVCVTANATWNVISSIGILTIV
jgi:hypothetical protein